MRKAIIPFSLLAFFLLVPPFASLRSDTAYLEQVATPIVQGCEEKPANSYTQTIHGIVDGDELHLRISARFGGAVESLTWRGKEFINIWDHGRQIGYAWGMDGYGECLNPTEPGSASDGRGPTSTTQLLSACHLADNSLSTTARVAYWLAPGQSGGCGGGAVTAVNDTVLSNHILEKTIEIGYQGIDNVIAFSARITMPEVYHDSQLEIPTGYLTYEFNDYWLYNPKSRELIKPASQPITGPWSFENVGSLPPILATKDGAYAMGAYSAEPVRYYSILGTNSPTLADRTNKWNIVVREEPALKISYTYTSFVIVGTLEQVQEAMQRLYELHPADFNPPTGWIDVANCQEIAGWAWDPKAPNQPIPVEVYDLQEDGTQTLLTRMIADQPRGDLETALGDNGEHGFNIQTRSILHDDQRHRLRIYAVNSDPALPNRYLYGATSVIECPELRPTLELSPTNIPTESLTPTSEVTDTPIPTNTPGVRPTATTEAGSQSSATPIPSGRTCLGAALSLVVAGVFWLERRRR